MNTRNERWARGLLGLLALALVGQSVSGGRVAAGGAPPAGGTTAPPVPFAPATSLPPLPTGLPTSFSLGLYNVDLSRMTSMGVPWNLRYNYLSGGVNTGNNWATWESPRGQYAVDYITQARSAGTIPVFMYYEILQSAPAYEEFTNLNTPTTMYAYYDDFKLLMQKCAQVGGPVFVGIETDLTGRMQAHPSNTNQDANLQPTSVATSGHPDVQGYANTFRGFYQALVHLRDLYAPQVRLALDLSAWGAGHDVVLALRDDPNYDWLGHATRTATYLNSLGPGYQMLFYNPLDRDAAYYQTVLGSNRWWDDQNVTQPTFDRMLQWLNQVIVQTNKRTLLWQIPNGNRVYRSVNNTTGHWQDNRAEYFLNPSTGRAHLTQWAAAGVVGIMFGEGLDSQTHYYDYNNDGITNPPAINGNTAVATYADDDGGYIRLNTATYYQQGTIPLPGTGPVLVGHGTWQGRPTPPNSLDQLPLTLTLRLGNTTTTYANQTTDASGFFTMPVTTLPSGVYSWWAKGPQFLASSGTVQLTGAASTALEIGQQRAGDANNDNLVDITDFTLLRGTFGKACGDGGYDGRADFTGDCLVDITDFTLQRGNFGQSGPASP